MKSQLIGKDPDSGKDGRKEEKQATENEMVGWRHLLNGHEFEQTLGDDEGQGSLACCSPRNHKESDTIEKLNKFLPGESHAQRSLAGYSSYGHTELDMTEVT